MSAPTMTLRKYNAPAGEATYTALVPIEAGRGGGFLEFDVEVTGLLRGQKVCVRLDLGWYEAATLGDALSRMGDWLRAAARVFDELEPASTIPTHFTPRMEPADD